MAGASRPSSSGFRGDAGVGVVVTPLGVDSAAAMDAKSSSTCGLDVPETEYADSASKSVINSFWSSFL